jgi:hypothetical protein
VDIRNGNLFFVLSADSVPSSASVSWAVLAFLAVADFWSWVDCIVTIESAVYQ